MKRKRLFYLVSFLFFLVILFLCPIAGDDWSNYIVGKSGFVHSIGNAVGMYFDWEGRFLSRIFINLLTYNKWLWNIINSVCLISIIYIIIKFIKPKNKKVIYILSFMMIIFMNLYIFSQTVTWIAGNVTYLFVIPLILAYFYYIIYHDDYNKLIFFLLIISNFLMTMFVEHMSLVLILGNILILIYKYFKNKKIDKRIIIFIIAAISGFLVMFLSPGNRLRSGMENLEFNELSFFGKVIYNIPNFIYYTFIINYFLLILLSISNYYLICKYIKNKVFKIVIIIYMLFIAVITIFVYLISNFKVLNINFFIDQNSIFIILYWISYIFIYFLLLIKYSIKNNNYLILFFFILGLFSNGVMLISPTWGFRTSLFTYICFSICSLIIIDKFNIKNYIFKLLIFISSLGVIFYIILYISVYLCNLDNKIIINKAIKNNDKVVVLNEFPSFANCNINPGDEYHLINFKKYYGINDDVLIKFNNDNWKYVIFYVK